MHPSTRLRPTALLLALLTLLPLAACQKHVAPPSQPQPTPAQRLESARQAVVAGNCAETMGTLDELTRQMPQSAEAFLLLGLCAAKQNTPERAEIALSKAASLEPENPRPLEALGILRYSQSQFPAAKDALAKAASRNSANPQTYYYLGNLAMQAGNCPDALANYRKAMAKDPAFSDAFKEYRAAAAACAKANQPTAVTPATAK